MADENKPDHDQDWFRHSSDWRRRSLAILRSGSYVRGDLSVGQILRQLTAAHRIIDESQTSRDHSGQDEKKREREAGEARQRPDGITF